MTPDEENLTASAKLLETMREASKEIAVSVNKAKANGVVTREEADKDRKSINLTTLVAAAGMVFAGLPALLAAAWFLIHQMIDPVKDEQSRQSVVQVEIQKDIRELYRVSSTQKSDRLERPVPPPPPVMQP